MERTLTLDDLREFEQYPGLAVVIKLWANTTPITATPTASKKPQIVRLKLGMVR